MFCSMKLFLFLSGSNIFEYILAAKMFSSILISIAFFRLYLLIFAQLLIFIYLIFHSRKFQLTNSTFCLIFMAMVYEMISAVLFTISWESWWCFNCNYYRLIFYQIQFGGQWSSFKLSFHKCLDHKTWWRGSKNNSNLSILWPAYF